jgi:hypothetical protein
VTHYYLSDRRPFLNLSTLAAPDLDAALEELRSLRQAGGHERVFGKRYMEMRRLTEQKLRRLFAATGGVMQRQSPHYFVLGESEWFGGLARNMKSVVLPLAVLPPAATSFTYPDSFTAMALGPRFGLPYAPRPYHDQVFPLARLDAIVQQYGLPDDAPRSDYAGYTQRPFEKYIEVQLWTDDPVRRFLN